MLRLVLFAILMILVLPGEIMASGFITGDQGGRATGMGSSVTADDTEPAAIFYNPSVLPFIPSTIYAGFTYVTNINSHENLKTGLRTDSIQGHFFIPHLYAHWTGLVDHAPGLYGLSVGLGFNAPYGLGSAWPDDWEYNESIQKADIQGLLFNPTLAWAPTRYFSIGAGLDIMLGSARLVRALRFGDFATGQVTMAGGPVVGLGGNVGLFGRLYETPKYKLCLGAAYRSTIKMDLTMDVDFDVPVEAEDMLSDQKADTGMSMPDELAVGLRFWLLEHRLSIEFDFIMTFWQRYKDLVFNFHEESPPTAIQRTEWSNNPMIRLGLEWWFYPEWAMRFGFVYDENPVPDHTLEPSMPDNKRVEPSIGFGFKKWGFIADIAYMFLYTLPRTVSDNGSNLYPGKYEAMVHELAFSVGYQFE